MADLVGKLVSCVLSGATGKARRKISRMAVRALPN